MKPRIVYPGTFDPITLGHVDLIERATKIFDGIIVAIAANTNKNPLFSLKKRVELAKKVLAKYKQVHVMGFDSLLIDFMHQHNARVILRGLRVVSDFDYEFQLAGMNRRLAPDIESIFLMPSERFTYISSSFVREVAMLHGDAAQFVPEVVATALKNVRVRK